MLELDGRMGYAAVNVGRREAEFSREEIERLAGESPVPLISANLADEAGKPVLPGHVLLAKKGIRFAVIGLLTPDANPGRGLSVTDPAAALAREIRAVSEHADFVILLAALDAAESSRVLSAAPGADLVLGGRVPRGSEALEEIGGVPCFLVQGKGQYVGEVLLGKATGSLRAASGGRIVLGPGIASEPRVESRIRDFEISLKDLDLLGRREARTPYAGSSSCAACHGEIHAGWKESGHAKSLAPLRPEKGCIRHCSYAGSRRNLTPGRGGIRACDSPRRSCDG